MSATGGRAPEAHASAFPWDDALALGLGTLRWAPDTFWRATPRELASAAGLLPGRRGTAATSDDLAGLIAAYPDP